MKQLTIKKNFHLNIKDKYTCKNNHNTVFVAEGTLLNHKLSFTIFDQNNKSIATIYNASENKQAASELNLDNGNIYTLEKINLKERNTYNHLIINIDDVSLIYLDRM